MTDLDPAITTMCDAAGAPPSPLEPLCALLGVTKAKYFELVAKAFAQAQPRLYTGYMPEAARRQTRHRAYCDGLRTRQDRTGRALAEMRAGR